MNKQYIVRQSLHKISANNEFEHDRCMRVLNRLMKFSIKQHPYEPEKVQIYVKRVMDFHVHLDGVSYSGYDCPDIDYSYCEVVWTARIVGKKVAVMEGARNPVQALRLAKELYRKVCEEKNVACDI